MEVAGSLAVVDIFLGLVDSFVVDSLAENSVGVAGIHLVAGSSKAADTSLAVVDNFVAADTLDFVDSSEAVDIPAGTHLAEAEIHYWAAGIGFAHRVGLDSAQKHPDNPEAVGSE